MTPGAGHCNIKVEPSTRYEKDQMLWTVRMTPGAGHCNMKGWNRHELFFQPPSGKSNQSWQHFITKQFTMLRGTYATCNSIVRVSCLLSSLRHSYSSRLVVVSSWSLRTTSTWLMVSCTNINMICDGEY